MNRAARRAFAKSLSRALGGAKAHRPDEEQQEDPTEARFRRLERENSRLKEQIEGLEDRHDAVPGVTAGRRDWHTLVGGERVDLKAIPPGEWLRTLEELPQFLFTFALQRTESRALDSDTLAQIVDLASRWITACAVKPDELHLDRLTLPEAEHAVAHIAELNGVTAHLRAWFQQRLAGVARAAPGRPELRAEAKQPAGDLPN